jgi:DNA-directed RNA polymerase subunit RPC12/RpoP
MFTQQQFQSARNKYQMWVRALIAPAGFTLILLLAQIQMGQAQWRLWLLLASVTAAIILIWRLISKKTLCRCPQCGSIIYPERTDYVLTRGKCPFCNHQVLVLEKRS